MLAPPCARQGSRLPDGSGFLGRSGIALKRREAYARLCPLRRVAYDRR